MRGREAGAGAAMLHAVDGLVFEAPFGFAHESTTVALRAAAPPTAEGGGGAAAARPNLVVHRQPAVPGATLAACEERVTRELLAAVPGLTGLGASELRFEDGARGRLLSYAFPSVAAPGRTVRQLQAVRLDGPVLTTITLTATDGQLGPAERAAYLQALASARLTTAAAPR